MTTIMCDRCGTEIDEDDRRQVSINGPDGKMEIILEDACKRCIVAARDFARPLPRCAPQGEAQ